MSATSAAAAVPTHDGAPEAPAGGEVMVVRERELCVSFVTAIIRWSENACCTVRLHSCVD